MRRSCVQGLGGLAVTTLSGASRSFNTVLAATYAKMFDIYYSSHEIIQNQTI